MDPKNKKRLKILIILILVCVLAWEISILLNFKSGTTSFCNKEDNSCQNVNIEESLENSETWENIQDLESSSGVLGTIKELLKLNVDEELGYSEKEINSFSEKKEQCLNGYSDSVDVSTLNTFLQLEGIEFFVSGYAKCLAVENNQSIFCDSLKDSSNIVGENTTYNECQNTFNIWTSFFSFLREEKDSNPEEICSEIVLGETSSLVKDFTLERCQLFVEAIQSKSKEKCQIIDIDNFKNSCSAFIDKDINLGMEFLSEQEENKSEKDIIKLLFPKIFQEENNICYNYFHRGLTNAYCGHLIKP